MKKILLFISGIVLGVLVTLLVTNINFNKSNTNNQNNIDGKIVAGPTTDKELYVKDDKSSTVATLFNYNGEYSVAIEKDGVISRYKLVKPEN